jgi:hypothetical protein
MKLDYHLRPLRQSWGAQKVDFSHLTDLELSGEVFLGEVLICVDDVDLSWHADLPLLDFAKRLYAAACELSPLQDEAYVATLDYSDRIWLMLQETSVILSATYTSAVARCSLSELKVEAARFGLRVFEHFVSLYPAARLSDLLEEWYPRDEMERTVRGLQQQGR